MNSAIARDAHGNHVVPVHCLLHIICESEILPVANAGRHLSTADVDIVIVVAGRGGRVEGDILVVAKGDEYVFLVTDAVETLGALDVSANLPMLRGDNLHGGGEGGPEGEQRGHKTELHHFQ